MSWKRRWFHSTSEYAIEYGAWRRAHERCNNSKHRSYPAYGGRGIRVCARWEDFDAFVKDMGRCPAGLTIERIDPDQGYDPFNCIWASWDEQRSNKRREIQNRIALANPEPSTPGHGIYGYRKHKCRCAICRAAFRTHQARMRAQRSPEQRQADIDYAKEYRRKKRNDL